MAIAILGLDGNPFTTRDIDASPNNFAFSSHLLVFSGAYVTAATGDLLDLTTIAGLIPSAKIPLSLFIEGNGPTTAWAGLGGYYTLSQNAALLNTYRVRVWQPGGAELGSGNYPATILADVVTLQILWRKLI
jgi:hypothetical protein